MAYTKQTFVNNSTVLTAQHLEHIEEGIHKNSVAIENLGTSGGNGGSTVRIADVELLATNWVGATTPYSQIVMIPNVTPNSQVDLTPSVEQLSIFYEKDLTFVTENDNGVVTVYAIGQKPENDYTIQVTITEVSV